MDLEVIIVSRAKSERERQTPYDSAYMWTLKQDTDKKICETRTDSQT